MMDLEKANWPIVISVDMKERNGSTWKFKQALGNDYIDLIKLLVESMNGAAVQDERLKKISKGIDERQLQIEFENFECNDFGIHCGTVNCPSFDDCPPKKMVEGLRLRIFDETPIKPLSKAKKGRKRKSPAEHAKSLSEQGFNREKTIEPKWKLSKTREELEKLDRINEPCKLYPNSCPDCHVKRCPWNGHDPDKTNEIKR